jgi:leucyl-tRNA synthetase
MRSSFQRQTTERETGVFLSIRTKTGHLARPFPTMSDARKPFPFHDFEPRWQARWEAEKTFRTPGPGDADFDAKKPKYYVLDMFPYPSGAGLHVGHPEGYTATDIIGRYKRMKGFNVLHPMGYDSFGLPAEQYAIKTGQHPAVTTAANIETFRRQLKSLGFGYDWDREIATTDPEYVRWTQWIFLQLYGSYYCEETHKAKPVSELEAQGWTRDQIDEVRLAFVADTPVWWSPDLGTVLANEEVEEWKSKGHTVVRRPLRQWMLRITKYAQRLIDELDTLDWPEGIKLLQKNWIGRSEGAVVQFEISDLKFEIEVFTTRPDTLFGATYMVLAPEHPLVSEITTPEQRDAVTAYQKSISSKSDMDRGDLNKDKSGVFTGAYATNPVNSEQIPVWIADYVMMGYGTGAIMAVPAHDERDWEFAKRFELPIRQVVAGSERGTGVSPVLPLPKLSTHISIDKTRRNLPHWQQEGCYYFLTWRLADSLPAIKLTELREKKTAWQLVNPDPLSPEQEIECHTLFSAKIEEYLDTGVGSCILKNPLLRKIVDDALLHFDGERYELIASAVMPNHVHVIVRLFSGENLSDLLHSWKSFTAKQINKATGKVGTVWQDESFDRIVRSAAHLETLISYVAENPLKAKLMDGEASVFVAGRTGETPVPPSLEEPFTDHGFAIHSGFLDGLPTAEAKAAMIDWLESNSKGKRRIQFKLRDWLFSRQRYWGEPFPIVWKDGRHHAIPESELPLLAPPLDDYKPSGTPEPILTKATEWVELPDGALRETNTMPQWAGSCWYYLRYCDPTNTNRFISKEAEAYWTDEKPGMVDLYVGGTEHAVLHLLYARFWHKVLYDLGHVNTPEPFQKLVNQGLILGEDGQKMSKSRGNVVNPDDVVSEYGADALRLYEMFMGPLEQVKPWQMKGVEGVSRFLARVWRVACDEESISAKIQDVPCADKELLRVVHETIKKVGEDIEKLSFNTAISQMMICTNAFTQAAVVPLKEFTQFLTVLDPFAPHLAEEIHARLGGTTMLSEMTWPTYDEAALVRTQVELVIQVNGKLRDRLMVSKDIDEEGAKAVAFASSKVSEHLEGKTIRKIIFIPGKIFNIVAN